MGSENELETANTEYVKKKVASASFRKAQKLMGEFEKEKQQDWDWALFVIIIAGVLALSLALAIAVSYF